MLRSDKKIHNTTVEGHSSGASNSSGDPFSDVDLFSPKTLKRISEITLEDPFNPANYAIEQEVADADAEALLTTIVVGKPSKQTFFRTSPDIRVPGIGIFPPG